MVETPKLSLVTERPGTSPLTVPCRLGRAAVHHEDREGHRPAGTTEPGVERGRRRTAAAPVLPKTSPWWAIRSAVPLSHPGASSAAGLVHRTPDRVRPLPSVTVGVAPGPDAARGTVPRATVAAARAMPNGVASTLPWPMPSSVRTVRSGARAGPCRCLVVDAREREVGADAELLGGRVRASPGRPAGQLANVVLQDRAYAVGSGNGAEVELPSLGFGGSRRWPAGALDGRVGRDGAVLQRGRGGHRS